MIPSLDAQRRRFLDLTSPTVSRSYIAGGLQIDHLNEVTKRTLHQFEYAYGKARRVGASDLTLDSGVRSAGVFMKVVITSWSFSTDVRAL